jgi:hypothetical protein
LKHADLFLEGVEARGYENIFNKEFCCPTAQQGRACSSVTRKVLISTILHLHFCNFEPLGFALLQDRLGEDPSQRIRKLPTI